MVWDAIAEGYRSPLMRMERMINQEKYREMLIASGVFESMDAIYGRGGWVFVDDDESPHWNDTWISCYSLK
jgi:hypothetical protein